MVKRYEISNDQWRRIKYHLPSKNDPADHAPKLSALSMSCPHPLLYIGYKGRISEQAEITVYP